MGGGVAVSVKGDWVIHKVLYTSSIAFHRSGTTSAVHFCWCSIKQDLVGEGCKCTKGDWVIHKVLHTSGIALHSSGTTAVLLL